MRLNEVTPFEVAGNPVDPAGLRVTVGGDEGRLEAKVMLVLIYLAEHVGRVVSRADLEEALWPGRVVTEDSVTKAIAILRTQRGEKRSAAMDIAGLRLRIEPGHPASISASPEVFISTTGPS